MEISGIRFDNSRKRRKVRRVFILSFLIFGLQWTLTATSVVSIGVTPETIIETSVTSGKILESLWKTFKKGLESAALSSATSALFQRQASSAEDSTTSKHSSVSHNDDSSLSQRYLLMKRSLQQHYTKQLVESSSPFLDDFSYDISSTTPTLEDGLEALGSTKIDRPIRWERLFSLNGEQEEEDRITCYFYSDSVGAYWSFQWCPQRNVYQGNLGKHLTMDVKHTLGSYHYSTDQTESDDTTDTTTATTTTTPTTFESDSPSNMFIQDLRHRFGSEGTTIELYDNGDLCEDSISATTASKASSLSPSELPRRIAGVIIHHPRDPYALEHCPKYWSTTKIESVDEHQLCQYVIHVCSPSINTEEDTVTSQEEYSDDTHHLTTTITESQAKQINQTMQDIHEVLHTYLHRGVSNRQLLDRTTSLRVAMPPLPPSRVKSNLQLVRDMFTHAYDGYMYKAYPSSELKPITCKPAVFDLVQIPALTLIDSLDMLIVMGNYTEFARSVERLRVLHNRMAKNNKILDRNGGVGGLFALNQNVSVFETNIRVLGGLLSGHQLAEAYLKSSVPETDVWSPEGNVLIGPLAAETMESSIFDVACTDQTFQTNDGNFAPSLAIPGECSTSHLLECDDAHIKNCQNKTIRCWAYDGFLLELAQDIGSRLLPAFSTKTGIPYGTVNLLSGIPKGETTIASLAGGGTLSLEMELLSRLTGDPRFGQAAKLSARALWMRRSAKDLLGKHLCTHRGEWTESISGIGSNSDSFYEYLIKHHVMFP